MKYLLTAQLDGSVKIESSPDVRPPLGLVIPAGQDVRHDVTIEQTIGELVSSASPALLKGTQIHTSSKLYVFDGDSWLDQNTEENAESDLISGIITFRNPSSTDIGITW